MLLEPLANIVATDKTDPKQPFLLFGVSCNLCIHVIANKLISQEWLDIFKVRYRLV